MSLFSLFRRNRFNCTAVIVAAGSSSRFGVEDKLLAPLAGAPVLAYCLRTFDRCEYIKDIVVVAESGNIERIAELVEAYGINKVSRVVCGGATRLESALAGVSETERGCGLIAIHDGARPLVTDKMIRDVIENAKVYKAAIPALHIRDTVKEAGGGMVKRTVDRSSLYSVQTPQVFERDVINAALSKAFNENLPITDDSSAVEAIGKRVRLCDGDEHNIKITTPLDLKLAELIIKEGGCRF